MACKRAPLADAYGVLVLVLVLVLVPPSSRWRWRRWRADQIE